MPRSSRERRPPRRCWRRRRRVWPKGGSTLRRKTGHLSLLAGFTGRGGHGGEAENSSDVFTGRAPGPGGLARRARGGPHFRAGTSRDLHGDADRWRGKEQPEAKRAEGPALDGKRQRHPGATETRLGTSRRDELAGRKRQPNRIDSLTTRRSGKTIRERRDLERDPRGRGRTHEKVDRGGRKSGAARGNGKRPGRRPLLADAAAKNQLFGG